MLRFLFIAACLASAAFGQPNVSGIVQDSSHAPIDGADITVWGAATGKGIRTSSSMGSFAFSGLAEGDYLFKVEADGKEAVLGAFRLTINEPHKISLALLSAGPQDTESVGAGSSLRDAVRPPRLLSKPTKVRPAQVKKKVTPVYPETERKAGVSGTVKIAMIILPDGTVNDLVVLSAPNSNLAIAALLAVRRWQYSPTYLDDQPVEASLTVDVTFQR